MLRQMGNSANHPSDGDCKQGHSLQLILRGLHFLHNVQINNSDEYRNNDCGKKFLTVVDDS
jgi:hypothetical protein